MKSSLDNVPFLLSENLLMILSKVILSTNLIIV